MPPFAHNPTLHRWTNVSDPSDEAFIVYHIGEGTPHDGRQQLTCYNGTTPATLQCGSSRAEALQAEPVVGQNLGLPNLLMSRSLSNGSWAALDAVGGAYAFNNPGVMQLRNGSTFIVLKVRGWHHSVNAIA